MLKTVYPYVLHMMIDVHKTYRCHLVLTVDEFKHDQPLDTFEFVGPFFITEAINKLLLNKKYKPIFDQAFLKGIGYEEMGIGKRSKQTQYWNENSKYIDINEFKKVLLDLKEIIEEELKTGYRSYNFETPLSKHYETLSSSLEFLEEYKTKKFRLYIVHQHYPPYK